MRRVLPAWLVLSLVLASWGYGLSGCCIDGSGRWFLASLRFGRESASFTGGSGSRNLVGSPPRRASAPRTSLNGLAGWPI